MPAFFLKFTKNRFFVQKKSLPLRVEPIMKVYFPKNRHFNKLYFHYRLDR